MKVAIGQFGAPTTVLNASLYGVLETLRNRSAEILGIIGGVEGLLSGSFVDLSDSSSLSWLQSTPGAALRAGRYAGQNEVGRRAVSILAERKINGLIMMGGNGTMGLADEIQKAAEMQSYDLSIIGVPKTIDNDIVGIDFSPGFPSAAHFVIRAVRDLQIDLEAMVGFEQVRVVEVMGRRCGWLAAATALLPHLEVSKKEPMTESSSTQTPIICLPEQEFDLNSLLKNIEQRVKDDGQVLVVVSEGVRDVSGQMVLQAGEGNNSAKYMLGGIGALIAEKVRESFGYGVRYENLGLLQRCWNDSSLESDRRHAVQLGELGARALLEGRTGLMAGLLRADDGSNGFVETLLPLKDVAGKDRLMTNEELSLEEQFVEWLLPLVEIDKIEQHPRLRMGK
ncbi:diphosphate--fructose-6-phosphate 1-phosphotransferase [Alicyclobacillus sp. SO9]|uniref:diphosphate--fructose-6-phosphate 1-phosphotransferase n=1 Tax=Alicyclobacillus sp. SO9 TaxID=2665646 RepID=UPI0018E7BFD5|nr:diphosphate--fructose-6-phosphate 1-phosphotransferase [Alicyclobacillus sp. SO9]QQE80481.1 diphosphate--fructose-6-phosphate 1-phosphotransferase [Alicyclobacillus sp. SO9]